VTGRSKRDPARLVSNKQLKLFALCLLLDFYHFRVPLEPLVSAIVNLREDKRVHGVCVRLYAYGRLKNQARCRIVNSKLNDSERAAWVRLVLM